MAESKNLIIIGSGPAAHTAAIYAARAELHPVLFEGFLAGGIAAGGQLTTTTDIENFPGFPEGIQGPTLMVYMRKQSESLGVHIRTETVRRVDLSTRPFKVFNEEEDEFSCRALIIATGATAKRLHLEGEDEYWQRGISACAVCDGALPIFRNKRLMVIGGGDAACEEATYLSKFGTEVLMVVRRDAMRASKIMQQRVQNNPKIKILWKTVPRIAQGENNLLSHVVVEDSTSGSQQSIAVQGLFYAIGHAPNTDFLNGQLETDTTHYIATEKGSTKTSVEGVFAAGDVQDKIYRQAVTSAGSGCMAALDAERYLSHS